MTELTQPTVGAAETNSVPTMRAHEPAGPRIWESMKRHWVLTILPVVVLVPLAVAIGVARTPKYQAEARLIVGRLSITNPGLAGFVTATQSLAAAYARAVSAAPVTEPVGKKVGMTSKEVASRLEGSPIQLSPVFRVIATGASSRQAMLLANETSTALITYVSALNRENPDGPDLLRRFRKASREFSEANLDLTAAQATYNGTPTAQNKRAVDAAAAVRSAAELEKNTTGSLYTSSEAGQSTASLVSTLNAATTAKSDRSSVTQLLVLVAIIVGLLVGTALATAADRRERRQAAA
jgi:capsular polysaccharide biosynthesis protein